MKRSILYISFVLLIIGCKKSEIAEPTPQGTVNFFVAHEINNSPLTFDSIIYSIPSGYEISLTRLEYFISNIKFLDSNGNLIFQDQNAHYINGRNNQEFTVFNIPFGQYEQLEVTLGLAPYLNEHGSIPNTSENIGMIWPINMGGGYHFLKFEGHFRRPNANTSSGFAIHLGESGNEVIVKRNLAFEITDESTQNFTIKINPLEWLSDPNDYDFETDGNYTMGIPVLMQKIKENGQTVVTNISRP